MQVRIGELRDRVTFHKPVYAEKRVGQEEITYTTIGDQWGRWTDMGAREIAKFRQSAIKSTAELVIRYFPRIETDWEITRSGKRYHVESIAHDRRNWTTLTVYQLDK